MTTRHLTFAYPGDLETTTGGYIYDRRLIKELKNNGWTIDRLPLGEGFPFPEPAILGKAYQALGQLSPHQTVLIDGLALGVLSEIENRCSAKIAALIHHPLFLETGIDSKIAAVLKESEGAALKAVQTVICTSFETQRTLHSEFCVARDKITVALPGTEPAERLALMPEPGETLRIFCAASITPRKGIDLLIEALSRLNNINWTLRLAGSADLEPEYADRVIHALHAKGLTNRVELLGVIKPEALKRELEAAHIFALPSWYEGYGMAFAEALAYGLPIIGTSGGAIPDTVPKDCGILIEPGNVDALTKALRFLITDNAGRKKYAMAARRYARQLPSWTNTAQIVSTKLEALL